jgi:hypothetical protein
VARQLALGKRPERCDLHPAGERLGHAGHGEDVCRPREEEAAGTPVAVDDGLHREEQPRGSLDLVDDGTRRQGRQQPFRVGLGRFEDGRFVHRQVGSAGVVFGEEPCEGRLAGLASPHQEHCRGIGEGLLEDGPQVAFKHYVTRISPTPWWIFNHRVAYLPGSGLRSTLCRGTRQGEIRRKARSPEDWNLVFPDLGVSRHEGHTFHGRLSYEHSVERVAVKVRERGHRDGVLEAYRKKPERIQAEMLSEEVSELAIGFETALGHLDGELPGAGHAEGDVVPGFGNRLAGGARKPGIVADPPQESVSVRRSFTFRNSRCLGKGRRSSARSGTVRERCLGCGGRVTSIGTRRATDALPPD